MQASGQQGQAEHGAAPGCTHRQAAQRQLRRMQGQAAASVSSAAHHDAAVDERLPQAHLAPTRPDPADAQALAIVSMPAVDLVLALAAGHHRWSAAAAGGRVCGQLLVQAVAPHARLMQGAAATCRLPLGGWLAGGLRATCCYGAPARAAAAGGSGGGQAGSWGGWVLAQLARHALVAHLISQGARGRACRRPGPDWPRVFRAARAAQGSPQGLRLEMQGSFIRASLQSLAAPCPAGDMRAAANERARARPALPRPEASA